MLEVWKRRDRARRTGRAAVIALAAAASVLTGCGDKGGVYANEGWSVNARGGLSIHQ